MFQCFNCLQYLVIFDCAYTYEELGIEGSGTVIRLHCTNCGADIEYRISSINEEI